MDDDDDDDVYLHAVLLSEETGHERGSWWRTLWLGVEPGIGQDCLFQGGFCYAIFISILYSNMKILQIKTCWGSLLPWPVLQVLGSGWKRGLHSKARFSFTATQIDFTFLGCSMKRQPSRDRRPGCKGNWVGSQDQGGFVAERRGGPVLAGIRSPCLSLSCPSQTFTSSGTYVVPMD